MSLSGNRIGTLIKEEYAKQRGIQDHVEYRSGGIGLYKWICILEVWWTLDLQSILFILSHMSSLHGTYREIEAKKSMQSYPF